jgi:biopolymer transport protein ExbD
MAGSASQDTDEAISGINVTPLVDITLCLLIIFIVIAKVVVNMNIPLDLPKSAHGEQAKEKQDILSLILAADGRTIVDSKPVPTDDAVLPLAKDAYGRNHDVRAVIKADAAVTHGRVIHVLDLLKQAGVTKIAFGVAPVPSTEAPK